MKILNIMMGGNSAPPNLHNNKQTVTTPIYSTVPYKINGSSSTPPPPWGVLPV